MTDEDEYRHYTVERQGDKYRVVAHGNEYDYYEPKDESPVVCEDERTAKIVAEAMRKAYIDGYRSACNDCLG